jgi:putative ABC transport system ATP-binding protein
MDHGREVPACKNVDMDIKPNEFVGILGPSGSGKSSLLYLLSGLKTPTSGAVFYDGQEMSRLRDDQRSRLRLHDFGFVFQQPYLLGYLTALENVMLARQNGVERDEALALLDKLGLKSRAHRLPHEMSGGEKQRVCVARALFGTPKVIFADEPTASLDHANGVQVVRMLNENRGNGSLVMVTHDPSMLEQADRILSLSDGELVDQRDGH